MNASRNYIKNSQSKRKTRKNIEQKKEKFLANEEKVLKINLRRVIKLRNFHAITEVDQVENVWWCLDYLYEDVWITFSSHSEKNLWTFLEFNSEFRIFHLLFEIVVNSERNWLSWKFSKWNESARFCGKKYLSEKIFRKICMYVQRPNANMKIIFVTVKFRFLSFVDHRRSENFFLLLFFFACVV